MNGIAAYDPLKSTNPAFDQALAALHKREGCLVGGAIVTLNTTLRDTDYVVEVDTTAAAVTLTLPEWGLGNAKKGKVWIIKDVGGMAGTHSITIQAANNIDMIDGVMTVSITTNYGSKTIRNGVRAYHVI